MSKAMNYKKSLAGIVYKITIPMLAFLSACTTVPREPETPREFTRATLLKDAELPAPSSCELKKLTVYTICIDEQNKIASWVAYRLTRAGVASEANQRKGVPWKVDKDFPWLTNAVYLKSGFDKGHLAPAEDFELTKVGMQESFL